MTLVPVSVEQFSGLNLRDEPAEVGLGGAIDLLNVDFDRQGRVRSRDGYDNFTAAPAASRYRALGAHSTSHVLAERVVNPLVDPTSVDAISSTGAVTASTTINGKASFATVGTSSATYTYVASAGSGAVKRWDGSAWSAPAGMPSNGGYAAAQPADNRLVIAEQQSGKVSFSDAGAPETFGANNYVYLTPHDGELVTGAVAWRDSVFVFKQSKFFVFYGNSTDATGNPVFNYRAVVGVGIPSGATPAVAGRDALYFVGQDGIYATTGGPAARISTAVDPLFGRGSLSSFWQGGNAINPFFNAAALAYFNDRLYCTVARTGDTANTMLLVLDLPTGVWTYWNIPAEGLIACPLGGNSQRLFFSYGTGSNHVGEISSAYTTDDGAAITSRYRSGFGDLGYPGQEKVIRETELTGIGSVSLAWSRDFGAVTTTSTATVTLGTSPATARKLHRKSQDGELFSWQASGVSGGAWTLNRLTPFVRDVRGPAEMTT